jgi:RNA polymerase sigma factor (sigma-70 family)
MDAPVSAQRKAEEHADLDEVTLARAQRGDRDARAALIERYQRPVFALLSRMLSRQRALVEDMAQETFLRVLRALPTFDARGPARLGTWILTIATRLVLDHFRRRPEQILDLQTAGAIPTALPRPDQDADRRALAVELLRAVDDLGAPFRAAFPFARGTRFELRRDRGCSRGGHRDGQITAGAGAPGAAGRPGGDARRVREGRDATMATRKTLDDLWPALTPPADFSERVLAGLRRRRGERARRLPATHQRAAGGECGTPSPPDAPARAVADGRRRRRRAGRRGGPAGAAARG